MENKIKVIGAREHNLKNLTVSIPKNRFIVITGISGSGKSSLAFDILYTEGKRRYVESLSSYARQFLGISKKPNVDKIEGLCPAVAIDQKTVGTNPRSTVGTITEIYDYLRVLFARIGDVYCVECGTMVQQESPEKIANMVLEAFDKKELLILAPIVNQKKGEFKNQILDLFNKGYFRFFIDGKFYKFNSEKEIEKLKLSKTHKHIIDVAIDQLEIENSESARIQEAIEKSFGLAGGNCKIKLGKKEYLYSCYRICLKCAKSISEVEPRTFSFNSPLGACSSCHGLGGFYDWENKVDKFLMDFKKSIFKPCNICLGQRLKAEALSVKISDKNISELSGMSIENLSKFLLSFDSRLLAQDDRLGTNKHSVAKDLIKEIITRLKFLSDVGLSYLSLSRTARTLSGGESQRIRLATQIGSALSGVLYILDEPSIGLHQKDNDKLIKTLKILKDQGNTVIVIEHDLDTIKAADYLIEIGPGAGTLGGQIVATGTPKQVAKNKKSIIGRYLSGEKSISSSNENRKSSRLLTLKNATKHNLKDVTVEIPLGVFCAVSGVSGSGKSSLIMHELVPVLSRALRGFKMNPNLKYKVMLSDATIEGAHQLQDLVIIDQSPIGRTPRSNPATYLGIFDEIRNLFSQIPESISRGYKPGRFSFNVQEGRCFDCAGEGVIKVSMHFLPDVVTSCKSCKGRRYDAKTLEIKYRDKNISDILEMTAMEALEFFDAHSNLKKKLKLLCEVGLDYIALGQLSTTLSGGEAQRIKLVNELSKRGFNTLYILDEPTTGLHNEDIEKLLKVLNRLVDKGNSILVIEHNLDVLKTADYIIDLGLEGGDKGGVIVAKGTPLEVSKSKNSYTAEYLKKLIVK
ncbi:excinuclease ABC subunit A [candidate division TM6 bacterium RIFCSPHIGHO2_12_FULL_32_22]|nr:MAG: excinuclease ABC subunit A [candidate division TM6 bacterium RIFCSPHIGHO2_12_FULL_32_22]